MMTLKVRVVMPILLALGGPSPGFAQRTTGGISGNVLDPTGAPLPGAAVTLRGDGVAGSPSKTTSERGAYRFLSLPPGTYEIEFQLQGFQGITLSGIHVSVGATTDVSPTLTLASVAETITVTGESPVVDTLSNEVGANYDRDWVENAPLRRQSFFDVVSNAPGNVKPDEASKSSQVYGSSWDENLFLLDGTDITDNFFQYSLAEPNMDAIEEVEILTLGAPAEYGNLTGAVFNVVTRQGGDVPHGDVAYFNQSDALTGRNTDEERDHGFPFERLEYHDVTAQLGGPIALDKLWFFGSYQLQRDNVAEVGIDPGLDVGPLVNHRYLFKLNWQASPDHKFQGNFHLDDREEPYSPGINSLDTTRVGLKGTVPTPGLSYTGLLGPSTTVDARYSGFYGDVEVSPLSAADPRVEPRFYDLDTSVATGGAYFFYVLDVTRTTFSGKISHFADEFLSGSHDFRFGVQYTGAKAGGVYGYNDLIFTYRYGGYELGYGYARDVFSYVANTRGIGVFADDSFRVSDRLSLNLGIRYDHDEAFSEEQDELDEIGNPTGNRFARVDYFTWSSFSPRFGFNWKLTSDGRTALKGHWGRYHRGIATAEFANIIGPSIKPIYFGTWDQASGSLVDLVQVSSNENLGVDPDYSSPFTDQYILSLARELGPDLGLNLDYVHKSGRNFGAWQDYGGVYAPVTYIDDQGADATGRSIELQQLQNSREDLSFEIGNREEMRTDVDALTFGVVKRMTGRWQMNGSATWMRSRGRLSSSENGSYTSQRGGLQFVDFGRDPNDFVNTGGRLTGDVPWNVKLQLVYRLPKDFLVSTNYNYRSGANRVRLLRVGEVTSLASEILAEERGEYGRLPGLHYIDVRLAKDFTLGTRIVLGLSADCFNLLNLGTYEYVQSSLGTSSAFNLPDGAIYPRRLMLGARLRF